MVAVILMIFLRIIRTLSFSTAHAASWTAQNWLDCAVSIMPCFV